MNGDISVSAARHPLPIPWSSRPTEAWPAREAPPQGATASGDSERTLMNALNAIDYGVMLVDSQAQVLHANASALRHVAEGAALRLVDGRVGPSHDRQAEAFRRGIASALIGRRTMLSLNARGSSLCLAFVPLLNDTATDEVETALLLLGKHEPCQDLSVEFFGQAHRLTRAEGVVLRGLCSGLDPTEIARTAGVAISTVRTQICSLRAKTQASSIRELVRTVALLPPMAPVHCRTA